MKATQYPRETIGTVVVSVSKIPLRGTLQRLNLAERLKVAVGMKDLPDRLYLFSGEETGGIFHKFS